MNAFPISCNTCLRQFCPEMVVDCRPRLLSRTWRSKSQPTWSRPAPKSSLFAFRKGKEHDFVAMLFTTRPKRFERRKALRNSSDVMPTRSAYWALRRGGCEGEHRPAHLPAFGALGPDLGTDFVHQEWLGPLHTATEVGPRPAPGGMSVG